MKSTPKCNIYKISKLLFVR